MSALQMIARSHIIDALGWTLLHSLWEGFAVAIVLALMLRAMRARSANARYVVSAAAMVIVVTGAVVTFGLLNRQATPIAARAMDAAPRFVGPVTHVAPVELPQQQIVVQRSWDETLRPLLPWFVLLWIAGVIVLGTAQLGGWMLLRRLCRSGTSIDDACAIASFNQLVDRLHISRPVKLVQSALIEVPTVIGWMKPVILLPVSAICGLSPDQLRGLLAHELAHVRRFDFLANVIQSLIETLLFYHPAIWWIGKVIRQERENACDDFAAAICDRTTYAEALATMEQLRGIPAFALSARGGVLLPRIRRILGLPNAPSRRSGWSILIVLSIVATIVTTTLVTVRDTHADDTKPPATKPADDLASAVAPTEDDLKATAGDYRISKNDLVSVTIPDLQAPGSETVKQVRVSDTGIIRLPLIGEVQADGKTEGELEKDIGKKYKHEGFLPREEGIFVQVLEARGRTFSIIGDVKQPGQYAIAKSDFRLLDALVLARDTSRDSKLLYVLRKQPQANEGQKKIIKIDLTALWRGDLKQNIVIRPDDLILIRPEKNESAEATETIRPHTALHVAINDLQAIGQQTVKTVLVDDRGNASLPLVGQVKLGGRTLAEAERKISDAYTDAGFLKHATVTVTPAPAELADALVSGVVRSSTDPASVDYTLNSNDLIHVAVHSAGSADLIQDARLSGNGGAYLPIIGELQLRGKTLADAKNLIKDAYVDVGVKTDDVTLTLAETSENVFEIHFNQSGGQDGMYSVPKGEFRLLDAVALAKGDPKAIEDVLIDRVVESKDVVGESGIRAKQQRLLAIPGEPLLAGDTRYNIVIKPKDRVRVHEKAPTLDPATSERLQSLRKELDQLEIDLKIKSGTLQANHPSIIALTQKIEAIQSQIATMSNVDIPAASTQGVRIVIGPDQLTLEGKKVTLDALKPELEKFGDRSTKILELAVTSNDVTVGRVNNVMVIVQHLGFKYISQIGVHALGSKAGESSPATRSSSGEIHIDGVKRPGVYALQPERPFTLRQLIAAAGGFENADHLPDTQILLRRRDGSDKESLQIIRWGDTEKSDHNPVLQDKDEIVVDLRTATTAPSAN